MLKSSSLSELNDAVRSSPPSFSLPKTQCPRQLFLFCWAPNATRIKILEPRNINRQCLITPSGVHATLGPVRAYPISQNKTDDSYDVPVDPKQQDKATMFKL